MMRTELLEVRRALEESAQRWKAIRNRAREEVKRAYELIELLDRICEHYGIKFEYRRHSRDGRADSEIIDD